MFICRLSGAGLWIMMDWLIFTLGLFLVGGAYFSAIVIPARGRHTGMETNSEIKNDLDLYGGPFTLESSEKET